MNDNLGHFINGKITYDEGKTISIFNPSSGKSISSLNCASKPIIDRTIETSVEAFEEWKNYSIAKKGPQSFLNLKFYFEKNIDKLAKIIGEDLGKVKDDAIGEVRRGIENVEYSCGIGEILKGEFNKNISTSVDSWSELSPLGVVLGITPFNFPVMVPLWMFPLAIAAGNSFILKPSKKTRLVRCF